MKEVTFAKPNSFRDLTALLHLLSNKKEINEIFRSLDEKIDILNARYEKLGMAKDIEGAQAKAAAALQRAKETEATSVEKVKAILVELGVTKDTLDSERAEIKQERADLKSERGQLVAEQKVFANHIESAEKKLGEDRTLLDKQQARLDELTVESLAKLAKAKEAAAALQ